MLRFILALTFLACPLLTTAEPETRFASVLEEVRKIQGETGLRNASLGFAIIPVNAREVTSLAGYHPDTALLPASTLKAVTTAAALELLGSDFRFTTTLQHTGVVNEEGILQGDLVIKGGGDPTLGASQIAKTFARWHAALGEAGIKKVEGRVIGDASIFGTQLRPDSWQWNDLGNYYAAGACGLTFHQNQFFCSFETAKPGTLAPFLGTDPQLPEVKFINEMRVGPAGSGDHGYVFGAPYTKLLYLRGAVPAGAPRFRIRGALPDPAYFCARAFSMHLEANKIAVAGEPTTERLLQIEGQAIGERTKLFEQKSAPLPEIIKIINNRSDNLYAECLHRMMGVQQSGEGSTVAASKAVTDYWRAQGIDLTGFAMADGCGLSRVNTITARQMTLILYQAAKSKNFDPFYKSLPVAGRSGTLGGIGRGSAAEGRVHAKSGSIERVKTYCGYIDAKSGQRYAFAILINHFTGEIPPLKSKIVRIWNKIAAL